MKPLVWKEEDRVQLGEGWEGRFRGKEWRGRFERGRIGKGVSTKESGGGWGE